MNDFLPPWLRELGEPEEEPEKNDPPPPAESSDSGLPPWLMGSTASLVKETGDLSDDFLAAADTLPDSPSDDLTYDEWLAQREEAKRPRDLEEDVPDLLQDAAIAAGIPAGTTKLPDTGELPDWFLGLEELDESQAPDWFVEANEPKPNAPALDASWLSQENAFEFEEQTSIDDGMDDLFNQIRDQRSDVPSSIPDNLFESFSLEDYDDVDSTLDDSPDEMPDLFSDLPQTNTRDADDFFNNLNSRTSIDTDELAAAFSAFDDEPETPASPSSAFVENAPPSSPFTLPSSGKNADETLDFEFEDPEFEEPQQRITSTRTSAKPEKSLSTDDLSWLNEISSIIDDAVHHEPVGFDTQPDDASAPSAPVESGSTAANASPFSSAETPDWLTQLQSMEAPEWQEPEIETGKQARELAFNRADFEDKPPSETVEDSASVLFIEPPNDPLSELRSEFPQESRPAAKPAPEPEPPPVTPKAPSEPSFASTPVDDLDRLASLKTDQLDSMLFGDREDISSEGPEDWDELDQLAVMSTDQLNATLFGDTVQEPSPPSTLGATGAEEDEYFLLAELSDSFEMPPSGPPARQAQPPASSPSSDEDLSWLHQVNFDDESSSQPLVEQPRAAVQPKEAPVQAAPPVEAAPPPEPRRPEPQMSSAPVNPAEAKPQVTEERARHYRIKTQTDELNALFASFAEETSKPEQVEPETIQAFDVDIPAANLSPAPVDLEPTAPIAADPYELNAIFDDSPVPIHPSSNEQDEFDSILEALSQASPRPEPERLYANTDELNALFESQPEDEDSAEDKSPDDFLADLFNNLSSMPEESPASLRNDSFVQAPSPRERLMPSNDDLDALFANLDDDDDRKADSDESEGLPSTGMLAGTDTPDDAQPGEDDLEALFAAFEDEQRTPASESVSGSEFDFPDDDSFFSALGLEDTDASPPVEGPPKNPPEDPDTDFFEGFSEPEMTRATSISGDPNTSMWEEDDTEEVAGNNLTSVPAFDFEAQESNSEFEFEAPVSDWFSDEDAETAPSVETNLKEPDWLSELDAIAGSADSPTTEISVPVAPPPADKVAVVEFTDVESFLAGLEEPDPVRPNDDAFPQTDFTFRPTDDVDAFFEDQLPDTSLPAEPRTEEELPKSELLSDLQASVGEVSAAALARQLKDKPEESLSDRLQKLRKRATDEFPTTDRSPAPAQPDALSKVLPGVRDTLEAAPIAVESTNLIRDIQLTPQQQSQVTLLRDLLGLKAGEEPVSGRLSAIDLTYDTPGFREDEALGERQPEAQEVRKARRIRAPRTYRIDRLLVSLLLVVGCAAPFFVPQLRIGALPPGRFAAGSDEANAFSRVNRLSEFDLVLIALEYGPAAAPELDEMSDALIRHVLLRGARPVFISGNPFGVLRAQILIDAINQDAAFLESINQQVPLEANVEYFVTRFLPGSATGLRAFGETAGELLTVDINGQTTGLQVEALSNLSLLMVISDRSDEARAYAEQIAPLVSRPIVAAVNYASAPLVEPYVSTAFSGLLIGYEDAYTYQSQLSSVTPVLRGERPVQPVEAEPATTTEPGQAPAETPAPGETPASPEATPDASAPTTGLLATVVSADGANVRSGPGTDFARISGLRRNAQVEVLEVTEDWIRVRLPDGGEGWVSAGLVVLTEVAPAIEATPTSSAAGASAQTYARALVQNNLGADDTQTMRWYVMNAGILTAVVIIGLGSVLGILRGIVRRRSSS